MQNIAEPTNKKELRQFIGLVNYYRDMWVRQSHILAPLARLTTKTVKWEWGHEQRKAFQMMKKVISKEALLAYPNFQKKFGPSRCYFCREIRVRVVNVNRRRWFFGIFYRLQSKIIKVRGNRLIWIFR